MTKSLLTGWNWQFDKTFKNRAKRIIPFPGGSVSYAYLQEKGWSAFCPVFLFFKCITDKSTRFFRMLEPGSRDRNIERRCIHGIRV